jgi:DnaJ-class molecular chaperone
MGRTAARQQKPARAPAVRHVKGRLNPGDEAPPGMPGTGEAICPECNGNGQLRGGVCPNCGGTGRIVEGIAGG